MGTRLDQTRDEKAVQVRANPTRFIAGMVITPVVSTLEITEPDIEPMNPEAKMATLAAPPRNPPTRPSARSLKNAPPPVRCSTAPNRMKPMTRLPKDLPVQVLKRGTMTTRPQMKTMAPMTASPGTRRGHGQR